VLVLLIVVAPLSSGDESRLVGLHIHGQRPNDGGALEIPEFLGSFEGHVAGGGSGELLDVTTNVGVGSARTHVLRLVPRNSALFLNPIG